jgi:hypothetical protein
LAVRPVNDTAWDVVSVVSRLLAIPSDAVTPYSTCDVPGVSVVQRMVAAVGVMLETVIAEM